MTCKLALENLNSSDKNDIQEDLRDPEKSRIIEVFRGAEAMLSLDNLSKVEIVITADFINSISSRQLIGQEFDMSRGSGIVAGKTMPPDKEGLVHIVLPLQFVLLGDIDNIRHVARHEAVHAYLYLLGTQPFSLHIRKKFGPAMTQFIVMAGAQIEEHLAERVSLSHSLRKNLIDSDYINDALTAFDNAIAQLSAIPQDVDDYFVQCVHLAFSAFHILCKVLVLFAAELRVSDSFEAVPGEITSLPLWKSVVEPYWREYLKILGDISMTMDVDVAKSDIVVERLAKYLQRWSLELGFDYHDTPDGQGFFKITNSDIIKRTLY